MENELARLKNAIEQTMKTMNRLIEDGEHHSLYGYSADLDGYVKKYTQLRNKMNREAEQNQGCR